ncbi:hypothetical protein BaRGS_00012767 [Batillaria attramentaria]|uniref:KH homology domain-containing protein 4 n=1 Tax=Batillaria attramentaria TaxID=370345 RepID=A0ABD0L9V6_9CAEN
MNNRYQTVRISSPAQLSFFDKHYLRSISLAKVRAEANIRRRRYGRLWFPPQQSEKSSLEAAAEAAAKVNAMLIAKGKLRPNQINNNQQYQKKGNTSNMVAAEVEINDAPLSMRNMLTRGPTQEEITKASGAAVSTRGRYMTPVAVQRINEILMGSKGGGPTGGGLVRTSAPLPPQPQPPSPAPGPGLLPVPGMQMPPVHQPPPMLAAPVQPPELQQMTVVEEKLYIGLEHAPPNFDVKNKIMGPGGSYLMHIQTETGAKVMLRGKGSSFIEPGLGRETFEPMHIHIQHPTVMGLQQAKQLAENLIQTVQQTYANFQQVLASLPPPVAPGPPAFITGIQQPTSMAEAALVGPPPGLPTITALQDQQLVQSAPGLQPTQTVIVPSSSMSSVIMPAGSIASSLPAINHGGQPGAPGVMMPTTMSLASMPVVSTVPIYTQTHLLQAPPGGLDLGQQQLIVNQGPPPQPIAQVNLAPQMSVQTSIPASQLASASSFPGLQHTVQLVSQPAPAPPGLAPLSAVPAAAPGQPPPFQHIYSHLYQQEAVSSGPAYSPVPSTLVFSSSPSNVIYSVATSSAPVTYNPTKDTEPVRRRFTEEKDDKIPENLLGYQHGPPHLVNLVCSSPPPGQGPPGLPPGQPALLPAQGQPGHAGLPPGQPTQVAMVPGQPGHPGLQPPHPGLQPSQHVVPPGHPGIATSFAMQPGLQVQAVHTIPTHLGPPPAGMSPVSQPYHVPPSSLSDDIRFGVVASSAAGMMPPPPPPASVAMSPTSNGDPGHVGRGEVYKPMMPPPPSRSDGQWGSGTGSKRGSSNGDRSSEREPDRKRRKESGSEEGEEDNGSQSPSVQRESPKPGTPTQVHVPRSQNYSPVREPPTQDVGEPVPQLPPLPPPPPQHQHGYPQFEISQGLPQHLVHPGSHINPGHPGPPYDPQVQPPPPPPHQQYLEHASQPPPPPLQYQEVGQQFPPLGTLPPHSQPEIVGVASSQPLPNHGAYPPFSQAFSQPGPPSHFITSPPASSHSTFNPAPQFIHQPRMHHPQGPPPPPPPPPASQHYHPGPAPPAYWHG